MSGPVDGVRRELPALAAEVHLNTGGAGPLPRACTAAIHRRVDTAADAARMSLAAVGALEDERAALRSALAGLLGADPAEVALTGGVTHGINAVIWGLDWREGDEVVTTDAEHPGLAGPLAVLARRRGVRLRFAPVTHGAVDLEAAVGALIGPRTRLVALSHVAWGTGARLDVEGAARAGRSAGAFVLIDGAQAVGAIRVDPRAIGADAYAFPAQKWLLGPEGLGALWVSADALGRVEQTIAGIGSGTEHRPDGTMVPYPDARRLEIGTLPDILVAGWLASLRWLSRVGDASEPGWPWIWARTARMAARARGRLTEAGTRILTPDASAGLVTFVRDGLDPASAAAALESRGIVLRWVPEPYALRASVGFFTTDGDLERLAAAIADLGG